jgi:putative ABC transport system permease protein
VLRDDDRTSTARAPLRAVLVVGELAIALVLLAGAGLLFRSFLLVQRVDPGSRPTTNCSKARRSWGS